MKEALWAALAIICTKRTAFQNIRALTVLKPVLHFEAANEELAASLKHRNKGS